MPTMREILSVHKRQKFATDAGVVMHKKLQRATRDDDIIKLHPELAIFFGPNAQTEVPIAGHMDGKFISRRIDRMVITGDEILFVDYKTAINKFMRYANYVAQIKEYHKLLSAAYPAATVRGFILWTYDFTLEEIC